MLIVESMQCNLYVFSTDAFIMGRPQDNSHWFLKDTFITPLNNMNIKVNVMEKHHFINLHQERAIGIDKDNFMVLGARESLHNRIRVFGEYRF